MQSVQRWQRKRLGQGKAAGNRRITMAKNKKGVIEDQEWLDFKARGKIFMEIINPKPPLDEIERRKKALLDARINK